MGFLNSDAELNPEASDNFKSLFSGRLAGLDDPLGSSRQGSALHSGGYKPCSYRNTMPQSGRVAALCCLWLPQDDILHAHVAACMQLYAPVSR